MTRGTSIRAAAIAALAIIGLSAIQVPAWAQRPQSYTDSRGKTAVFPNGVMSFADRVEAMHFGTPRSTAADGIRPSDALRAPDKTSVTLGCRGSIVVRFVDNVLIDVPGPDLYVFEIGPDVESTLVEISADGQSWLNVGPIAGATTSVDISAHAGPGASFRFVRLTDLASACGGGGYPGADIDAVGAIGSARASAAKPAPVAQPTPVVSGGSVMINRPNLPRPRPRPQSSTASPHLQAVERIYRDKLAEVAALLAEVDRLAGVEAEKRRQLDRLRAQASAAAPNAVKTLAYRRYEARIAASTARMAQILARLDQAHVSAKGALVDEYRALERQTADDRARLATLDKRLGVDAGRATAGAAIEQADAAHLQAVKDLAHARSERNIQSRLLAAAQADYERALARQDQFAPRR